MFEQKVVSQRRARLIEQVKKEFGVDSGAILLFSGFEPDCRYLFRPENYFLYLTGIKEPCVAALLDLSGSMTLFEPNCTIDRSVWESCTGKPEDWSESGVDEVKNFGQGIRGITLPCSFSQESVETLVEELKAIQAAGGTIFSSSHFFEGGLPGLCSKWFYGRLSGFLGYDLFSSDIGSIVDEMRKIKDSSEIKITRDAIEACINAQKQAASKLCQGMRETELRNIIQDSYDAQDRSGLAFRTIVATGQNATVLHHGPDSSKMGGDDLVVVDIGCESDFYSSDLTRTYPVSGKFTPRQAELYSIVLAAQKHVESLAKPGVLLRGEKGSLHQAAVDFFKERGLEKYFPHGVGHYMGLDVHDVGSYTKPLEPGCVFTIEPGLYIPEEGIGIRIEDDYWLDEQGNLVRLSQNLPREIDEIEAMVAR